MKYPFHSMSSQTKFKFQKDRRIYTKIVRQIKNESFRIYSLIPHEIIIIDEASLLK